MPVKLSNLIPPKSQPVKTFILQREEDISGISGTGVVAEGCLFQDGSCVLHWFGKRSSINVYHNMDDLEFIHSHSGKTKIIFQD